VQKQASAKRTALFPEISLIYRLSSITASSYRNALVVLYKNKTVETQGLCLGVFCPAPGTLGHGPAGR
jgi:hypothetical protein